MRRIYLASDSRARKQLLNILGLKFKVIPSRAQEKKARGKLTYAELVKTNALNKAMDVAGRVKSGLVIAADTIVVQDGKIFGKPKGLKAAEKMLKKLTQKPQLLYTGIAVIDKDKNRKLVSCEKTKIFMDRLSDKEIDSYFRQVSPLDKAGSFDIQGKGAFFIRRIEGCFYNVVGLPLRRLYLMLKKLDIRIFLFLLAAAFISGCSTEYNIVTGEQETYMYSTEREVAMGKSIAAAVAKEYKFVDDPLVQKRVEDIGKKIAAVCDRKDIDYHFFVLDDEEINAVALPGGYVYINKGLIDKVTSDDQLAGVVGHEVGHIVARHSIKKLQADQAYSVLRILVAQAPGGGGVGAAADAAFVELYLGYSREDELLADQLGTRYSKLAGYDPHRMIKFLENLQEIQRHKPLRPRTYYKTHPYVPDRIRVVKQELGEDIEFDDWINIEQSTHK